MTEMTEANLPSLEEVFESFEFLDDWEERYRYIIDLGRQLPAFEDTLKTPEHKVEGCVSQVWLIAYPDREEAGRLHFRGDSDAHIVRGLIAILLTAFSGKRAEEIASADGRALFDKLGLGGHLSPSRSNGLFSMVQRIRTLAAAHVAEAPAS